MSQFTDLCILLGCDYLEPVKGVGPKTAFKLIKEHGDLKTVLKYLLEKNPPEEEVAGKRKGGIQIPEYWPWEEAKKIFEKPDVLPANEVELEWRAPDVDGLVQFLVNEKGFNEERVRKGAEKLAKFLNVKQQGRLDGFFSSNPKSISKQDGGKGGRKRGAELGESKGPSTKKSKKK